MFRSSCCFHIHNRKWIGKDNAFFSNEFASTTEVSLCQMTWISSRIHTTIQVGVKNSYKVQKDTGWLSEQLQSTTLWIHCIQLLKEYSGNVGGRELLVGISLIGQSKNSQRSNLTKLYISTLRKNKQEVVKKEISPTLFKV